MSAPEGLIITKLARHADGYWTANVNLNGAQQHVDLRCGSWQFDVVGPDGEPARKFLKTNIAAVLSKKVRQEERREAAAAA